jgi:hypothetical protein
MECDVMNLKIGMEIKLPSKDVFFKFMGPASDDISFGGKFKAGMVEEMYDDLGQVVQITGFADSNWHDNSSRHYNGIPTFISYRNQFGSTFLYDISALILPRRKLRRKRVITSGT